MVKHVDISTTIVFKKIKNSEIAYGGNSKLKIYGTLSCKSGKRMKKENRVFFKNKKDALSNGYRPCGHCMRNAYKLWKDGLI